MNRQDNNINSASADFIWVYSGGTQLTPDTVKYSIFLMRTFEKNPAILARDDNRTIKK